MIGPKRAESLEFINPAYEKMIFLFFGDKTACRLGLRLAVQAVRKARFINPDDFFYRFDVPGGIRMEFYPYIF